MGQPATQRSSPILTTFEQLRFAQDIIRHESNALGRLAEQLPLEFSDAIQVLLNCRGAVIVMGMGKAGWIGQKISASLASTGTRSHFLHPGEAMHGDLGRIADDDCALILSNSGETEEIVRLLPVLKQRNTSLIAITGQAQSALAKAAHVVIDYGTVQEACPLGLAPTTSTALMLALGDALALVAARMRQFTQVDFAKFHPGGSIGKKLTTVDEIMRPLDRCRVANDSQTIREILISASRPGRRSGAILLVDEAGRLSGIFTDSDLARLLEKQQDAAIDSPISHVMTRNPTCTTSGARTLQAIELLAARSISELPVVDQDNRPIGLVDITDVVGLLPNTSSTAEAITDID
jgi:arabinose-5-phosphate isomerase